MVKFWMFLGTTRASSQLPPGLEANVLRDVARAAIGKGHVHAARMLAARAVVSEPGHPIIAARHRVEVIAAVDVAGASQIKVVAGGIVGRVEMAVQGAAHVTEGNFAD